MKLTKTQIARTLVTANPHMTAMEVAKKAKIDVQTVYGVRWELKKKGLLGVKTIPEVATTTPIEKLRDEVKAKTEEAVLEEQATLDFITNNNLNFHMGCAIAHIMGAVRAKGNKADVTRGIEDAAWHLKQELTRFNAN